MPGDYEQLKRTIEDGVRAAEELQKLLAEQKRERRPKLRLIKGGAIGGAIALGVEWFGGYRRIAVALAATGLTATGAVIAEQPHAPGADPPNAITRPAGPKTSVPPQPPTNRVVVPTPRRTSPPRTLNEPAKAVPTQRKTRPPETATPRPSATKTPTKTVTPKVIPTIIPTIASTPAEPCTGVGLLGLCIIGN